MNANETGNNQLAAADGAAAISILPRNLEAQINDAIALRDALTTLFEKLLVLGKDYARIPGTDRPALLKSGAEMLCKVFTLAQGKVDVLTKSEDWDNGIFSYMVGAPLVHMETGLVVAYGVGSANSMEKKHRYRKTEVDGKDVQINNPEPADLQNTLFKMASKRAYVDATLKATCASRFFTQDEDLGAISGQFEAASSKQIGLIKKLFAGTPEADAMAEISAMCQREVKGFGDIRRTEASGIIDKKKAGGGRGAPSASYGNGNRGASPTEFSHGGGGIASPASGDSQYADYYADYAGGYGAPPMESAPVPGGQQYGQFQGFPKDAQGGELACGDCGKPITKAEHGYSIGNFGRALCRQCQQAMKMGA
jgi:hypothetical protein